MNVQEFRDIVTRIASETGRGRSAVSITYREDPDPAGEGMPWIVGIDCRFARSRTAGHYTNEGYGSTPSEAATDAMESLRRAIADGRIAP